MKLTPPIASLLACLALLPACTVRNEGPAPASSPAGPELAQPTAPVAPAAATPAAPAATPTVDATNRPAITPPATDPPVVGGYAAQDAKSPAIVAAGDEAFKLLQAKQRDPSLKLVGIRKAETQIVAGTNYRLELDVTTAKGPKTVKVVLYKALDGHHELTSVEGL